MPDWLILVALLSLALAAPLLTLALVHGFRCEKQQCRPGRPCAKEETRR